MIGIIGVGNMGTALTLGIKQNIIISDVDKFKLMALRKNGVVKAQNNIELTKRSEIIILAVKPQDIIEVLKEIAPFVKRQLIISIAAGVKTDFIERILGKVSVVRVMPNMPALVRCGISALAQGRFASSTHLDKTRRIFSNLGEVIVVKEKLMDAVTAISGSGPAYYYLFTLLLERAGRKAGLGKDVARQLAIATFIGAGRAAELTNTPVDDFINKIASKGGTTEAALKVFKTRGLERIVEQAVKAAARRSRYLSRLRPGE